MFVRSKFLFFFFHLAYAGWQKSKVYLGVGESINSVAAGSDMESSERAFITLTTLTVQSRS